MEMLISTFNWQVVTITLRDFSELTTLGPNQYYKIKSGATSGSSTLVIEIINWNSLLA